MNYCNLISEECPETWEEYYSAKECLENLFAVLNEGGHILPRQIAIRLNIAYYDSPWGCFCQVKKKAHRNFMHRLRGGERYYSTVYLYTDNINLISTVICDVYGPFVELDVKPSDGFITGSINGHFKIGIPYEDLVPFLERCVGEEIDALEEWRDEFMVGK